MPAKRYYYSDGIYNYLKQIGIQEIIASQLGDEMLLITPQVVEQMPQHVVEQYGMDIFSYARFSPILS